MNEQAKRESQETSMHRREITLADGRYMIFYTFDDADGAAPKRTSTPVDSHTRPDASPDLSANDTNV